MTGIPIDWLVRVGFTQAQVTDISAFFRNVGYAAKFTADDLVTGVNVPANKIFQISSYDALKTIFKSDTQFFKDIEAMFNQKTNSTQDQSKLNNVVVYQVTETDYEKAVDNFVKVNANWAQLVIDSRDVTDISKAAPKALSNNRLLVVQTSDETIKNNTEDNIAELLNKQKNSNVIILYHADDTEGLAAASASIMAQSQLGLLDIVYATATGITPQDYDSTTMTNLKNLNVGFYSEVNPINGGGVSQYASPIIYAMNNASGEDIKQKYTKFSLEFLMKARSIDFLKKRKPYEDMSAKILDSMLSGIFIEGQRPNGAGQRLIKQNTVNSDGVEIKGFDLAVGKPSDLQENAPTLYNSETYPVTAYARDAKTGKEIEININIDPTASELASMESLLGKAA